MRIDRDTYNVYDKSDNMSLAIYSVKGDRSEQQDSAGYSISNDEMIIALCDGMGGHASGREASTKSIDSLISLFDATSKKDRSHSFLVDAIESLNQGVLDIADQDGNWAKAGTTLAAVISDGKTFDWVSVGDSRIYVLHNGILNQITTDHTYKLWLDEQKSKNAISQEEYENGLSSAEKLISFLGVGDVEYIGHSENVPVEKGDKILLMSDGLYKLLPNEAIESILKNFTNVSDALAALEYKVKSAVKNKAVVRDNMTLALLKIM